MALFEQVSEDIKAAMLARDKVRLMTLRNIKKLFRLCISAHRPEPCSGSSGHNDAIAILSVHMCHQ